MRENDGGGFADGGEGDDDMEWAMRNEKGEKKGEAWGYFTLLTRLFCPLLFCLSCEPCMHVRHSILPFFVFESKNRHLIFCVALLRTNKERKRQRNLQHGLLEGGSGCKVCSSVAAV